MLQVRLVLLLLAFILLAAAGFGIQSGRVNLVALGLAFWVLSLIVP